MVKKNHYDMSIIIPIYNCGKYIKRCIDSILKQNGLNFEIILINDGSSDNSGKICDGYSEKYNFIEVIHKKNEGVSSARNEGLKKAKGKYIYFCDCDDYLENGMFDKIKQILNDREVDLINFGFYSIVENSNLQKLSIDIINYEEIFYKNRNEIKKNLVSLWDNTMLYNIWNKVYKKDIILENNIKFPNYDWGEDVEFNRLYLDKINNFYNSKECFYNYVRERDGSATKQYKHNIFEIRKKEFYEFNNYFDTWEINKDEYYEYSSRRYIERLLGCIENIYCIDMSFSQRYKEIKIFINDSVTIETLKYAKPKSNKVKIMLIPIKLKSITMTMLMGRIFNITKTKFPALFNRLKNKR